MRALIKERSEENLKLKEIEFNPSLGPHDVLVRVRRASICGSDVHIYKWEEWIRSRMKLPRIIGHEYTGEVVKTGELVTRVKEGDLVASETHIPCGHCYQCLTGRMHICKNMKILGFDIDGAFADYVVVPEVVLWKLSEGIEPEYASVMEPLGNAVHTALATNLSGKTVLITGAGPIGLMAIEVARVSGASFIIVSEVKDYRIKLAKEIGADVVVNPLEEDLVKRVMKETNGEGVDVFLEMSGKQSALIEGLRSLTNGGVASLLGIFEGDVTLNLDNLIIFKGITVYGITGRKMFETWRIVDQLLKSKKLDLSKIVTHVLDFEEWEKGFELMMKGECGKVVLKIND